MIAPSEVKTQSSEPTFAQYAFFLNNRIYSTGNRLYTVEFDDVKNLVLHVFKFKQTDFAIALEKCTNQNVTPFVLLY